MALHIELKCDGCSAWEDSSYYCGKCIGLAPAGSLAARIIEMQSELEALQVKVTELESEWVKP